MGVYAINNINICTILWKPVQPTAINFAFAKLIIFTSAESVRGDDLNCCSVHTLSTKILHLQELLRHGNNVLKLVVCSFYAEETQGLRRLMPREVCHFIPEFLWFLKGFCSNTSLVTFLLKVCILFFLITM